MKHIDTTDNLMKNLDRLQQHLSDENLAFLPEYRCKVAFLKDLGFLNSNKDTIKLKGRIDWRCIDPCWHADRPDCLRDWIVRNGRHGNHLVGTLSWCAALGYRSISILPDVWEQGPRQPIIWFPTEREYPFDAEDFEKDVQHREKSKMLLSLHELSMIIEFFRSINPRRTSISSNKRSRPIAVSLNWS